jgi:predicted transcriptional regulator of viral defense system
VFQVAVDRHVRDRTVGRTRFEFAQRDVGSADIVAHPTQSGKAWVSSVATTALDLAVDVSRGGGIDNVATVLVELADQDAFDPSEIARAAVRYPAVAGRRVGYLLERFADRRDLASLHDAVGDAVGTPSRLDPRGFPSGPVDRRWMLYLNREVEPDV